MENYDDLIGLTIDEAKAARPGNAIRVVMKDGEHYMVTMDYRMDRINVHIEDGKIVYVTGRG